MVSFEVIRIPIELLKKMWANGYGERKGELIDGPDQYTDVVCQRYDDNEDWNEVHDFHCTEFGNSCNSWSLE